MYYYISWLHASPSAQNSIIAIPQNYIIFRDLIQSYVIPWNPNENRSSKFRSLFKTNSPIFPLILVYIRQSELGKS